MRARTDPAERFWAKVDFNLGGCWEWTASIKQNGYGQFSMGRGVVRYAHRLAYEWTNGPIPEGLVIDHLCRNRACVNPDHLEAVTASSNVSRACHTQRRRPRCRRGHAKAMHEGNNYSCKACRRGE